MDEAKKLIGEGRKHLVMGKVVEAVGFLQEACGMLAKKYGDTADECGEAFYWCGKALLDLARMENSVLGNALEGVPEEEEEEKPKDSNIESTKNIDEKTRDELRVQVYDAMAEKNEDCEKTEVKQTEDTEAKQSEDAEKSGDAEKAEAADEQEKVAKADGVEEKKSEADESKPAEKEEKKTEEAEKEEEEELAEKTEEGEDGKGEEEDSEDAEMEGDTAEEQDGEEGTAEKDSDDEEEVGNLQLAWEMLEVAKGIYKRKESKEDQLMAAQAHLRLGEVSSESGNYSQALEDFQECLKLQLKHLDSDSRLLAETHYQLGLTYSLNLQYSPAIKELNSSISVIKTRLENLQELQDKAEGPDALPDKRKEMEELKALLPEIQEKVVEVTAEQKIASAASEIVDRVLNGESTSSGFPGSTVQNGDSSSSSKINGTTTNGVSSTNGHASTVPVSDISHLVRSKRKQAESPVKEGALKKVKQDNAQTNGVQEPHTDDGHKANGDTKTMEVESQ